MPAAQALDAYFLDALARLLDVAAILDRIDRGGKVNDPRAERLRAGVKVLLGEEPNRAEKVQECFSLAYDPAWEKPKPRM